MESLALARFCIYDIDANVEKLPEPIMNKNVLNEKRPDLIITWYLFTNED